MADAPNEAASFAAILEQKLRIARTSGPSVADAHDTTAAPNSDRGAIEGARRSSAPEARAPSAGPEDETLGASLRSLFEATAERDTAQRSGLIDEAEPAAALPLDSARTFAGPNATYYDESWRFMEWRQGNRSWNWAAALTFGGWLAYRRLYGWALLYFGWLSLLLLLAANGTSVELLAFLQVTVAATLGLYGNMLYRRRFRKAAMTAAQHEGDHATRLAALAAAGGIDARAAWAMGFAMVAATALIVRFGKSIGGADLPL